MVLLLNNSTLYCRANNFCGTQQKVWLHAHCKTEGLTDVFRWVSVILRSEGG